MGRATAKVTVMAKELRKGSVEHRLFAMRREQAAEATGRKSAECRGQKPGKSLNAKSAKEDAKSAKMSTSIGPAEFFATLAKTFAYFAVRLFRYFFF